MKKNIYILIILAATFLSCQKEFLKDKTDKALLVPKTLTDFENLLDNLNVFNITPSLPVIASDDYYTTGAKVNTYIGAYQKNSYIWAEDIDEGLSILDWNTPYQQIFYANIVLDGLLDIEPISSPQQEWNRIKGSALFHRAFAFYNIAQMYAKPYNKSTARSDLGIPIRLEGDVNIKSSRGTLQQTYDQIIKDLKEAEVLLPNSSNFQTRPNKIATQALLARVYLNMEDYDNALLYATAVLKFNSSLIDYNTLSKTSLAPFPVAPNNVNIETIFYSRMTTYTFGGATNATVDNSLYESYSADDLRKIIFFTGSNPSWFKGRYTGSIGTLFSGLARDEIYLIKAECEARAGKLQNAMDNLNILLKTRYNNTVNYITLTAVDSTDALNQILEERRKELVFRGLRWGDLRRLNKDNRYQITISHTLEGQIYTLLPNSNRYTFPIPKLETLLSGLEQNLR
ncbi:RagB/SusD family nutrient uptake outer membrane protein [Pedobacter sp. Hv1]|uniref:RagB/SusD family nutrient uptake outer membrane protein n=1 Tax=Pedobacter sp. Hv1 TaxID=1740090 RepID=UPI000A9C4FF4|nr:RagB/SusD family nutrient uptake outer membrane protein [Pedobacter sp. Hv1]